MLPSISFTMLSRPEIITLSLVTLTFNIMEKGTMAKVNKPFLATFFVTVRLYQSSAGHKAHFT